MKDDGALAEQCRASVSAAERVFPKHFWPAGWPGIAESLAVGVAVAVRAEDLRPVAGASGSDGKQKPCHGSDAMSERHIDVLRLKHRGLLYPPDYAAAAVATTLFCCP